ncbi:hypothetical protein [Flavobacterium sp.]|uniref:hypothetical protein n=1 Tax=Flavobacterium sp. TaxID=239 RepID=UPI002ED77282
METVKEFIQSTFESYKDRVKSPFVGSFALSFILFNWKAFLVLLYSDLSIIVRIKYIEISYCSTENFVWPIVIALFYVVVLPYINLGIDYILGYYTKSNQDKKDNLETARLEKRKSNAKLLREIADEKAGTSEITNLQSKIESLTEEIEKHVKQNKLDNDRWNQNSKLSQEKESELNDLIKELRMENNNLLLNLPTSHIYPSKITDDINKNKLAEEINNIYNKLTVAEAEEFLNIFQVNGIINYEIKVPLSSKNAELLQALQENNLITYDSRNVVKLTELGSHVIRLLHNDTME